MDVKCRRYLSKFNIFLFALILALSRHCDDVLKCSIRKCINRMGVCACVRACMCVSEEQQRRAAIYWLKKRASNGFMFDEINVSTRSDFFNLEIRRGRDDL